MKKCRKCGHEGPFEDFHKHAQYKDGYENLCKKCQSKSVMKTRNLERVLEYNKKYAKEHPEKVKQWRANIPLQKKLLYGATQRAKERGVPCTILETDIIIPEYCPVLGLKLETGSGVCQDSSPSLDCINPKLGYIPGNVVVLSFKANTMKSNASLEELEKLVVWLKTQKINQKYKPIEVTRFISTIPLGRDNVAS